MREYQDFTVQDLRTMARSSSTVSASGVEISGANKGQLMKHKEIEKELIFARKLVKLLLNVFYEEVDAHAQVQTYLATVDVGYLEKYLEIIKESK